MNIAINGFGRIGRSVFKALLNKKNINIAGINDLSDPKILAHLLKYDTCYGIYKKNIAVAGNFIIVAEKKYKVTAEKEPLKLPWKDLKVDLVIEATGRFTDRDGANMHIKAGAKKVIISAPAKTESIKTIVLGVNENNLNKGDKIISMASCTTNCLAPITEIIRKNFGIKKAIMTTVHSYTADQNLIDAPHKDLRRARAAGLNIVPTTTGAAVAVAKTITSLKNKFDGLSMRVPTAVGSICDIVYITKKKTDEKKVNNIFKKAARSASLKGILTITEDPIVSSDIIGNPASAIVDLSLTKVVDGDLLKVVAWYDNEWGYSNRLADLCEHIMKKRLI
jgi:glyceraldehyde 3-phosphate dehydrogenase